MDVVWKSVFYTSLHDSKRLKRKLSDVLLDISLDRLGRGGRRITPNNLAVARNQELDVGEGTGGKGKCEKHVEILIKTPSYPSFLTLPPLLSPS